MENFEHISGSIIEKHYNICEIWDYTMPCLILLKTISQEFVSLLFMIMENKWKS
jgi:hypothetical protein